MATGPATSRFRKFHPPPPRPPHAENEELPLYLKLAGQVLRRPRAIPYLLQAAWAFRARQWYRRPPFLPVPPKSFIKWRMETAYGDADVLPSPGELERYLVWASGMRRRMRRGGRE